MQLDADSTDVGEDTTMGVPLTKRTSVKRPLDEQLPGAGDTCPCCAGADAVESSDTDISQHGWRRFRTSRWFGRRLGTKVTTNCGFLQFFNA